MKTSEKSVRGTAEWAVATVDCCSGCPHGCRYCYARYDLVERRRLLTAEQWQICNISEEDVARRHPLYAGQVMFPTNHDIMPENLAACRTVILNLLRVGNRVLVVSKPHLSCIEELCRDLQPYRDRLLFRFTITARNAGILHFWEPQAPDYAERKACLELAFRQGFATSVSVEPMLDSGDVVAMVDELLPFVSHSIWLGRMNKIAERVRCETPEMQAELARIEREQDDGHINTLYRQLQDIPVIRWKESIKTLVGLQLAAEPGLDV
ncbi:MAG: radical SAM protein [Desulfoprunum sp.]|nr:radical SAM protein [Desulfoprunum sp.]